ncbi:unnamed protein product [Prorocentrum cordatum]|uniref:Palmitoyltransferase n=1 Tax=Prorocentrum cordatum TaxID=2364126 RepID=A0ABN9RNU0_9DINO|nr:unnamed protein product [Polarella glacialis]
MAALLAAPSRCRRPLTRAATSGAWRTSAAGTRPTYIYAAVAHALLLGADAALCLAVLRPSLGGGWRAWGGAHQASLALTAWAHLACMLTDPGAVPLGEGPGLTEAGAPGEAAKGECRKCRVAKPPRAHHCSTCRRCVRKMDHHCMWMNNCVGEQKPEALPPLPGACRGPPLRLVLSARWRPLESQALPAQNQKHFLLFLAYLLLHCAGSAAAVARGAAARWAPAAAQAAEEAAAGGGGGGPPGGQMPRGQAMASAAVLVAALAAGRFAWGLLREQAERLRSGRTGIEQLQGAPGEPRALREALREVMGRGPAWRWLLPVPVRRA